MHSLQPHERKASKYLQVFAIECILAAHHDHLAHRQLHTTLSSLKVLVEYSEDLQLQEALTI